MMNRTCIRLILGVVLVSFVFSGYGQEVVAPQGLWASTKQKAYDFREKLLVQWFGTLGGELPLDPEMEALVKEVIAELNIPGGDQIRIRRMSRLSMLSMGKKNAFVVDIPGLPKYMFISEKFFRKLTKDEQRAIIGHELMHLKYRHVPKKIAFALGGGITIIIGAYIAYKWLAESYKGTSIDQTTTNIFNECLFGVFGIFGLSRAALSRLYEYQADEEAVKALGSYDGAISAFEKLKKYEDKIVYELPEVIQQAINNPMNKVFATHPPTADRIAKIQQLKEAAEIAAAA